MNSAASTDDTPNTGRLSALENGKPGFPPQRVVILGASNVMRNLSTVIATAEHFRGRPLDFLMATGHGRSYGLTSSVLGRSLPAIRTCALWDALAERQPSATVSLVTDVGNDLLYGASVETIASWVEQCLAKLSAMSDHVILTELPLENIAGLNSATFFLIRSILFPKSRLTLTAARDMSVALNERVENLARKFNATLIAPDANWYGVDPIHIRRRQRDDAWRQILLSWKMDAATSMVAPPRATRIPLRKCRPHVRWMMGFEQRHAQPALRLPHGTHISFF